jgi:monoamine oxidase
MALDKGSLIHPQYRQEFETSFAVSWHKTKYNLGGWALYSAEERQTCIRRCWYRMDRSILRGSI